MDEINFEKVHLEEFHCVKCGKLLAKFHLFVGKIALEIKCHSCNYYNTLYLEKKKP